MQLGLVLEMHASLTVCIVMARDAILSCEPTSAGRMLNNSTSSPKFLISRK